MLLLAGGQAAIEKDYDGAILALRDIIKKYPNAKTLITDWNSISGSKISTIWLMWAPSLVFFDENEIKHTAPFDKDHKISKLENEALTYFEHLEKHPQLTQDVAQYIIALMLLEKENYHEAIAELESLLSRYPDLSKIRLKDYNASNLPNGHLIKCLPPSDEMPIWRIQYAASFLLVNLYLSHSYNDKLLTLTKKLSVECSPDGWYWKMNKYLGDIYFKKDLNNLASKQYENALIGINTLSNQQGSRLTELYKLGYVIKPKDFKSWEDQALKSNSHHISKIKKSQDNVKNKK